jgi:membrane-bound serine protease (ClpP class)
MFPIQPNKTIAIGVQAILYFVFLLVAIPLRAEPQADRAGRPAGVVMQFDLDGPIGPASSDFAARSLDRAWERNARLVVIRMDTPGGLDTAMREIIKKILVSPVPVAAFVAPSGARAASAGTYILYASHIAAMAPGTNVGAATPVSIGGPTPGEPEPRDRKDRKRSPGLGDAMSRKMVNDAVAYLRGLAKLRGRNADWAEKAVREAASLPADDALAMKVIDLVAADVPDLLRRLEGRKVEVLGRTMTLELTGAPLEIAEPDWRSRLLAAITNPNVAYILMLVGLYGLILEFSHPGAVLPGAVGAISLMLALYAFQVLPINYAGLGLLLLGIALMVAEAFAPSFGALGIGGAVAFVIGSVMLMDAAPGFGIDPAVIAAFALSSLLFFGLVLGFVIRARRRPVVTGREELIGAVGVALEDFTDAGKIRIHGEIWNARTNTPVRKDERVCVKKMDGLTLWVEPPATTRGEP